MAVIVVLAVPFHDLGLALVFVALVYCAYSAIRLTRKDAISWPVASADPTQREGSLSLPITQSLSVASGAPATPGAQQALEIRHGYVMLPPGCASAIGGNMSASAMVLED
jgi:hypothetical protein